jgi:tol-pal system protein YbgF
MVRTTYPSKMSPAMIRSASLLVLALAWTLGPGAARAQDSSPDLLTRLDRLESTIRQLTGTIEQLQYRNQQLEQQVRRLQEAGDGRAEPLRTPSASAQRPPAPYSPPPPVAAPAVPPVGSAASIEPSLPPPGRRSDAFDPAVNPNAPGAPRALGPSAAANEPPPLHERPPAVADAGGAPVPRAAGAPLNLSTLSAPQQGGAAPAGAELPAPPPRNSNATGAMQATLPPSATPKDEYDLAYGYVMHKDYALAADTFRTFLRQYPSDRLAPEAQYWLGESLFQQQQYRDAAESFLAVSTKYETTARAPEALFRLGQSLAALGEKEAACASLGEVLRKYPRASQNVKQSVEREQRRDHC